MCEQLGGVKRNLHRHTNKHVAYQSHQNDGITMLGGLNNRRMSLRFVGEGEEKRATFSFFRCEINK